MNLKKLSCASTSSDDDDTHIQMYRNRYSNIYSYVHIYKCVLIMCDSLGTGTAGGAYVLSRGCEAVGYTNVYKCYIYRNVYSYVNIYKCVSMETRQIMLRNGQLPHAAISTQEI